MQEFCIVKQSLNTNGKTPIHCYCIKQLFQNNQRDYRKEIMRKFHSSSPNDQAALAPNDPASINYAVALIAVVLITYLFGCTMLYSTSSMSDGASFFSKQLQWGVVGSGGAAFIWLVGYKRISKLSMLGICITILLLLYARCYSEPIKGAYRWIRVPGVGSIQPSEFAKLAAVLFSAKFCSENIRFLNKFKTLAVGNLPIIFILGAVFLGKDLGSTCLIALVVLTIHFAAGVGLKWVLAPIVIGVPALYVLIVQFWPWRLARLVTFLDPEKYKMGDGYQLWGSLLALGSGGWTGLGFTESRMKAEYIPDDHTDFILAIVGEELGFVFILVVIIAYFAIMFLGVQISIRARSKHGMLLGIGVTCLVVFQSLINVGVVGGALPTKGMPAAFISYGGSNLILCLCCIGILLSIAHDSANPNYNDKIIQKVKEKILKLKTQKRSNQRTF